MRISPEKTSDLAFDLNDLIRIVCDLGDMVSQSYSCVNDGNQPDKGIYRCFLEDLGQSKVRFECAHILPLSI
jgi:hypothetical protein